MSLRRPVPNAHLWGTALFVATFCLMSTAQAGTPIDWNDAQIDWHPYDEGVTFAREHHRPICMVMYGEWCPHCHNFSRVFHDEKVVELARRFVMVHVDIDREPAVNGQFRPDGAYVPRTYFLTSQGELRPEIHEERPTYVYFYDERRPEGILRAMERALQK